MPEANEFTGEIKVASRIVDYLSSGLYESPAACLKELVNNSFDADAKLVKIFVKPDADRIIVQDDGVGMTRNEFVKHFERVSESHKRDDSDYSDSGRPKIGRIGIGFIAANEICEEMEIFSTKAGSRELLHVIVSFEKMRLDPKERKRLGDDYAKGDYRGEVLEADVEARYTNVFLNRVRGHARAILAGARAKRATDDSPSIYGLNAKSVVKALSDPSLNSWSQFDQYSQTMLHVGLNVPVSYYEGWLPTRLRKKAADLEAEVASLDFKVSYDGTPLGKPIILGVNSPTAFIRPFAFEGENVSARGYFFAQHGILRPQDLNGVLIRIRNAAVGEYDPSFLDFPTSEGTLFQRWISAEVWADDRLEEAMNIDRRTLRVSHPSFVELQTAVHDELSEVLRLARRDLYQLRADAKKKDQAKTALDDLKDFASENIAPISRPVAKRVVRMWESASRNDATSKQVLKRYTVEQLYRLVVQTATEVLEPADFARFLERLTEQLSKQPRAPRR